MSARKAKRRPKAEPTRKELQAALKSKSLKAMNVVAEKMGLPFWVLSIPGAGNEPDGEKQLREIVNLVQNFIGRDGEGKPLPPQADKPFRVDDCVGRLDASIAVLKLIEAKLWDILSEEGIDLVNDSHFGLELARAEVERVTGELREFPRRFDRQEALS